MSDTTKEVTTKDIIRLYDQKISTMKNFLNTCSFKKHKDSLTLFQIFLRELFNEKYIYIGKSNTIDNNDDDFYINIVDYLFDNITKKIKDTERLNSLKNNDGKYFCVVHYCQTNNVNQYEDMFINFAQRYGQNIYNNNRNYSLEDESSYLYLMVISENKKSYKFTNLPMYNNKFSNNFKFLCNGKTEDQNYNVFKEKYGFYFDFEEIKSSDYKRKIKEGKFHYLYVEDKNMYISLKYKCNNMEEFCNLCLKKDKK